METQVDIYDLAKTCVDGKSKAMDRVNTDLRIYHTANKKTQDELFKKLSIRSNVLEEFGKYIYNTGSDIALENETNKEQIIELTERLKIAERSGELSEETVRKLNDRSSMIIVKNNNPFLNKLKDIKNIEKNFK
jgi:hypothetical protein